MVDEKDEAILAQLVKNSRLSEKKIAQKTGIPITTVHNRIKKLTENGVILGSSLKLDYSKLGKGLTVWVMVRVALKADQRKLLNYITSKDSVYEAAIITGEYDIIFKARVADMEELNRLIVQDIRSHELVSDTRTMLTFQAIEK